MIVYLHGFNSSPASQKSTQMQARMEALGLGPLFSCPALPDRPAQAIALAEAHVRRAAPAAVTVVGSSLGGFYATWLAERLGVRAVLLNPAITPHLGLQAYLGPQTNLHTGEPYELTHEHLAELSALVVPRTTRMSRYYLLTATGDDLLDYRLAVAHYPGARTLVVQGSDHGLSEFPAYMHSVLEFAGIV